MVLVNSREKLIDYCKRELGWPVIEINVDDDQVEDRIDEALQYFQQFHYDATERTYLKHQITAGDIANNYITVSDSVLGINRIFPLSSSAGIINMFDIRYQMRLQDLQYLTSQSFIHYWLTQTHLSMIDMLLVGETSLRFNRNVNRLYIDWDWDEKLIANEYIVIEALVILDPDSYTKVYNDKSLKQLATAYIKRQWGANMKKFGNVTLPGNVVLNGKEIYDEALAEIEKIEQSIRLEYEAPPMFIVG